MARSKRQLSARLPVRTTSKPICSWNSAAREYAASSSAATGSARRASGLEMTTQLARHRRGRPAEAPRDLARTVPALAQCRDALTLQQRQMRSARGRRLTLVKHAPISGGQTFGRRSGGAGGGLGRRSALPGWGEPQVLRTGNREYQPAPVPTRYGSSAAFLLGTEVYMPARAAPVARVHPTAAAQRDGPGSASVPGGPGCRAIICCASTRFAARPRSHAERGSEAVSFVASQPAGVNLQQITIMPAC